MNPNNNPHHKNPNIFGEFNLKITFDIFIISLIVSTVATIAHALIPKDYKNTLTFAATTFATSVGGLGAFYAYKNLSQTANSKVIDRTLIYLQRWNDPQYVPGVTVPKENFCTLRLKLRRGKLFTKCFLPQNW